MVSLKGKPLNNYKRGHWVRNVNKMFTTGKMIFPHIQMIKTMYQKITLIFTIIPMCSHTGHTQVKQLKMTV